MTSAAFTNAALALALGMGAQALAERFAVPSIILLLLAGVVAGPDGLGVLQPTAFGGASRDLVALAVTIILFEGGLALRVEELRRQQRSLLLLLTVGAGFSFAGGASAARYALRLPWDLALLYGALVIVTGPTVVTPLLNSFTVDRPVRELLTAEAVLIDPIGAVVAIVVAEYIVGGAGLWQASAQLAVRLGTGAAVGAAAGLALAAALRRHWLPDDLRNPFVFAAVVLVAALSSQLSSEAGLMAAVVQGVVMANAGLPALGRLRRFKEELTVLLLSFIFVLLAADLRLAAIRSLGWQALLVVAILMWIVRPLAVFACTAGSTLRLAQRLFIAWLCPRGIVAASVAGLFGILLRSAQMPGADRLEALVFVTVAVTVLVQGLSARPVARLLGVDLPALGGTMIIGADTFGRLLARALVAHGRQVVLLDNNASHCRAAHADGLTAYRGDALSADDLEDAGARYADTVVALTRNTELNVLVSQRLHDDFRVERVLVLGDGAPRPSSPPPFPGNFPGVDEVERHLRLGRGRLRHYAAGADNWVGKPLPTLPYAPGEFVLLLERSGHVFVAGGDQTLAADDRLLCFLPAGVVSPLDAVFTVIDDSTIEEPAKTRLA